MGEKHEDGEVRCDTSYLVVMIRQSSLFDNIQDKSNRQATGLDA